MPHIDDYLLGKNINAFQYFGAHFITSRNQEGVVFRVYAPFAKEIEVIGNFNGWLGSNHKMIRTSWQGVFELFIPGINNYDQYKYHILTSNDIWINKSDPFAFYSELRPSTASKVFDIEKFVWNDDKYMKCRKLNYNLPMNIYEMHLGSWIRDFDGRVFSYQELESHLINYLKDNNFNYVEFLPLMEHPLDGSWGYQVTGFYSITSRYGNPYQLMHLIDELHKNGIGVIFDFVAVHMVTDEFGLSMFDGSPVYEYKDITRRKNNWGTSNFDFSKGQTRSFVASSMNFFAKYYHLDGIRLDAISNLIYYNGDKNKGLNNEGISFLKFINEEIHKEHPALYMIAEDSTDFQKVTFPVVDGGLGFDYKWDLGWMNDTLKYYSVDPIYRKYEHSKITFSMYYFFSEKFILPFSHDEVVHGKNSIVNKMWGNYDEKFAQLRNLYVYMFTHPGKKLNFMGNEIAHFREWDEDKTLDWFLLDYDLHRKFNEFFKKISLIYNKNKCLYYNEYDLKNFNYIMADNKNQSIFVYERKAKNSSLIIILNMTPCKYDYYEFGVPYYGEYEEILNSDDMIYGGKGTINNHNKLISGGAPLDKCEQRLGLKIGSFAAIILEYKRKQE
ncbi:MAG: 1,4-alpha-glucan branching protein GlgB [Bacilli bacterium]|nr:1,4-alpha-glucan branching protein GlgB [Bacilli bacterium]